MFRCLSSLLAVGVIGARLAAAQTVVPPPAGTADTNATQPIVIYPAGQEPQPEPSPVLWQGHVATLGAVREHDLLLRKIPQMHLKCRRNPWISTLWAVKWERPWINYMMSCTKMSPQVFHRK